MRIPKTDYISSNKTDTLLSLDTPSQKFEDNGHPQNYHSSNKLIKKKSQRNEKDAYYSVQMVAKKNTNFPKNKSHSEKHASLLKLKTSQSQFYDLICKTFNMFPSNTLSFNEFVLGLECMGVKIEHDQKFQQLKNQFQELSQKQSYDSRIDFENFVKIAMKELKQQKSDQNSDLNNIQKCYYYMIQQCNSLNSSISDTHPHLTSKLQEFKKSLVGSSSQKKHLTKQSLQHLLNYLNASSEYSSSDLDMILSYLGQSKGYITFADLLQTIQQNGILRK